MRFEFDTNALTGRDVLILTAIAAALNQGTRAPEATGMSSTTGAPTDQGEGASAPVTDKPAPPRVRRTKAQIEADNLAAEAAARAASQGGEVVLSQTQQDAVDDTAGILTTDQKASIAGAVAGTADASVTLTAEQVAKIVDLDALRAALQTYTAKHDLAAGIALLGSFECKRISEVLALPAEKQQAFLLACNV